MSKQPDDGPAATNGANGTGGHDPHARGAEAGLDERFADWVDGRLSAEDRFALELEIAGDPDLARAAATYRRTVDVLREHLGIDEEPPDYLVPGVLGRLETAPAPRRWLPVLASASAAAGLLTLFFVLKALVAGPDAGSTERGREAPIAQVEPADENAGAAAAAPAPRASVPAPERSQARGEDEKPDAVRPTDPAAPPPPASASPADADPPAPPDDPFLHSLLSRKDGKEAKKAETDQGQSEDLAAGSPRGAAEQKGDLRRPDNAPEAGRAAGRAAADQDELRRFAALYLRPVTPLEVVEPAAERRGLPADRTPDAERAEALPSPPTPTEDFDAAPLLLVAAKPLPRRLIDDVEPTVRGRTTDPSGAAAPLTLEAFLRARQTALGKSFAVAMPRALVAPVENEASSRPAPPSVASDEAASATYAPQPGDEVYLVQGSREEVRRFFAELRRYLDRDELPRTEARAGAAGIEIAERAVVLQRLSRTLGASWRQVTEPVPPPAERKPGTAVGSGAGADSAVEDAGLRFYLVLRRP